MHGRVVSAGRGMVHPCQGVWVGEMWDIPSHQFLTQKPPIDFAFDFFSEGVVV